MAPFGPWAGLPSELLLFISNDCGLPFESYCRVRGVCTAWRAALPPPIAIPSLVTVSILPDAPPHDIPKSDAAYHPVQLSALFLRADRPFHLATLPKRGECVGSSNGWLAVTSHRAEIFLLNPLDGGQRIPLRPLNDGAPVSKIVFAPNPTPEDYVAVAIWDRGWLAYTRTRDRKWTVPNLAMEVTDRLADLAYDTDAGKVYCVTECGDVHVLHILQQGRRRGPVLRPLQADDRGGAPFDPAAIYAAPYDTASKFTGVKRIFFLDGGVYQVWRNTTSAVSWTVPGGGRHRMAKDEVIVLRYDPGRQPACWDVAKDLGGRAVFVGKNNPVVLRPEDAPGVRANCMYWMDQWSRNRPMVFDMATGTSTPHPLAAKALNPSCRPACWYFLDEKIMSVKDSNPTKRCISGEECDGQVSKKKARDG